MEKEDLVWFRETFAPVEFPIIMFGLHGVGKTALTINFFSKLFTDRYCRTMIGRQSIGIRRIDKKRIKFNVWDIAGFPYKTKFSYLEIKNMKAAIIVYDVTNYISLHAAKKYYKDVKKQLSNDVIMLVANKVDLLTDVKITDENLIEDGKKFAKKNKLLFIETSAKNDTNVEEIFYKLYYAMRDRRDMWYHVLQAIL